MAKFRSVTDIRYPLTCAPRRIGTADERPTKSDHKRRRPDIPNIHEITWVDLGMTAQSIYARLDKANAASELRSVSLDEQIDRVLERDAINAQLEERKKKLAK